MNISDNSDNFDYATLFCDRCDYSCRRKDQIRLHKATKHEGYRFKCTECDKEYQLQQTLKDHIKAEHEGVRFKCDQCDITFKSKDILRKHKPLHNVMRKNIPCPYCMKLYSKENIKGHIRRLHSNVKKYYPCHLCGLEARSIQVLKKHVIDHMKKSKKSNWYKE